MRDEKQGAHLVVCPDCGKHAAIVYADGDQSESFRSKVEGKMHLLEAINDGHIAGEEVRKIEAEIDDSTLPFNEYSQEIPESIKHFREELNRRRLFGGNTRGVS